MAGDPVNRYLVVAKDSDGEVTTKVDAAPGDDVASLVKVLTRGGDPPASIELTLERS